MITALPPRSMTSSATWRPMPALPPTTTIFLPSNSAPIGESPFLDFMTCYVRVERFGCVAPKQIGDRRAGLSEVKPGPLRGELSSPRSANHPGEDKPRPRPPLARSGPRSMGGCGQTVQTGYRHGLLVHH